MPLNVYNRKRDFSKTPEPRPGRRRKREEPLRFVVQKHAASRLHFDLRLEADGVLKSWAVPKGPSLDPADKRLAVMVEDHPLEYFHFEGVIPPGEYGAGEVIVWDRGIYTPYVDDLPILDRRAAEKAVLEGIREGKISFQLQGERLRGRWALARKEGEAWLLIKKGDEFADEEDEPTDENSSVISTRTLKSLRKKRDSLAPPAATTSKRIPLEPMLATLTDSPFSGPEWVFEPKLDGMRVLAVIGGGQVSLYSRRGQVATHLFPRLVDELKRGSAREMILDGEIVAPGPDGAPSFQLLQKRINLTRSSDIQRAERAIPVRYYVFDLLNLDGKDLRTFPLAERRDLLERSAPISKLVDLVAQFPESGELAYAAAVKHGFEGVIAKRRDSRYEPRRSRAWLKVKTGNDDEFVIGGYTAGNGRREGVFGSLLLGQFDAEGVLRFSGHVGTGFDDSTLDGMMQILRALRTEQCPFSPQPKLNARTTWVRPELVATIKYLERTRDGILRAPVFIGLRSDKSPQEASTR